MVVIGAACASAGSAHGVVRGAGNDIKAEGAAALAAALQGNKTLETLDLSSMWTALLESVTDPGDLANARAGRRERLVVVPARCGRVRAVSTAWCVVQGTASTPRAPLRWRRRSKATRRCRRSTYTVCGPLARAHSAGVCGPLPGDLASARAETCERLVVVAGAAWASAGSEHGVVRGAGNGIEAEGAVALAAALQGNTTLQTLNLYGTWTARTRAFCRNRRAAPGDLANARAGTCERLVVVVGAACASAGSAHGVVRGAGNGIEAEGAVALAAALQGNTTLQTLNLCCMWTARTREFCGHGRPRLGPRDCAGGEARAAGGYCQRGAASGCASVLILKRSSISRRQGRDCHREGFERR